MILDNFSVSDIISIIGLVIASSGGTIGLVQWNQANKVKKAEYLDNIIQKLRYDEKLNSVFRKIEYSNNWYNSKFHNCSEEQIFDELFSYLDYICYLRKNRILSNKEFRVLQYELNRVCGNYNVQTYLWNVYQFSKKNNAKCPYENLINYAENAKIINRKMFESVLNSYEKTLNF